MLSATAISEFKQLYFKHSGVSLSDQEAHEKSEALLNVYRAVYRPNIMKMEKKNDNDYDKNKKYSN